MNLKLTLACLLAFFVTAQFIGVFLHRSHFDKYDFPDAKVGLAAIEHPDIIFVGASHIDMGINPSVFDAEMAKQGYSVHSYNLGIDGLSVVEMSYFLRKLIDGLPCCILYAVLSPCFQCLNVARKTNNIRSIDFFTLPNAFDFARYVLSYEILPQPKLSPLTYVCNIFSALFRHYSNLGLGAAASGWSQFEVSEPDFHSASFWAARGPSGHAAVRQVMAGRDAESYPSRLTEFADLRAARIHGLMSSSHPHIPDLVTDGNFASFIALVSYLQDHGIAVLVIQPPSVWEWDTEAAFVAKLESRCHGRPPLIDFGDFRRYQQLFLPIGIRYDDAHMNDRGAVIWSQALAHEFVDRIQSGVLTSTAKCDGDRADGE